MPATPTTCETRLPKSWPKSVKSAMLHVISLAQFAIINTRSWAADSMIGRIRFKAQRDRANDENALLREQLRIVNARMVRIPPQQRPHYPPTERLAILELKAARGRSLEQTAKAFLVTAATVASCMKRVDEDGPDALVQLRTPVNKFPQFVGYVVQRLRTLSPTMGNSHRPHSWLGGRTPDEVYHGRYPASRRPRYEPRARWPQGSPCAQPWALVRGKPGARFDLELTFHAGRRHLPIVRLKRAA